MIKRLKAFVSWLESRFPEKVVVSAESYSLLTRDLARAEREITTVLTAQAKQDVRISVLEQSSVHKEAVQDLITIVKALKDDVIALKANLGWSKAPEVNPELQAMLNGEII